MTVAYEILQRVKSRLGAIEKSSGYNTNIGRNVSLNKSVFNYDEIGDEGEITVWDSTQGNLDDFSTIGEQYVVELPITVEAAILVETENRVLLAHQVIEDIKRAVLLTGGTNRTMNTLILDIQFAGCEIDYDPQSSDVVGVQIVFLTQFIEIYGTP